MIVDGLLPCLGTGSTVRVTGGSVTTMTGTQGGGTGAAEDPFTGGGREAICLRK